MKQGRDPQSGKRVLRFLATSALVVAPTSAVGCGGANQDPTTNVVQTPEPEATNVDHHEHGEEHTNVAEEAEPERERMEAKGGWVGHGPPPQQSPGQPRHRGQTRGFRRVVARTAPPSRASPFSGVPSPARC